MAARNQRSECGGWRPKLGPGDLYAGRWRRRPRPSARDALSSGARAGGRSGARQALDSLIRYGESLPYDSDDASLIRVAHREYQKKIKVPPDHIARAIAHGSASYDAWTRARPANDFAAMVPYLERTLDLSREYSSYFAPYKHVADPHIDDADEGMTTASTHKLFEELKTQLVPIVSAICEQPADRQFQSAANLCQSSPARFCSACCGATGLRS